MVDKSKLVIATSQTKNPIPFLIELLFNLLSQMITIVVLIKIETKIEYNKIKSTRNYFELCLTV
jgi:hypothetical protein